MEQSQFLTDVGGLYGKLKTVSILYGTGGSHLGSLNFDTLDNLRREHGRDSAIWQRAGRHPAHLGGAADHGQAGPDHEHPARPRP